MIETNGLPIESVLTEQGFVAAHPIGLSMRPFLRANDTVVLLRLDEDAIIEVGSSVLFKRDDGVLVLHRVVSVKDGKVLTRGDFELYFDAPVDRKNVLAVMTEFYRGKKHVLATDADYLKKIEKWNGKGRKRRVTVYRRWIRLLSLLKRAFRKIFKRNKKQKT